MIVSIPSRGFWFFEGCTESSPDGRTGYGSVSIPSRGFWFFEAVMTKDVNRALANFMFQSPRGDFGFLK